MATNPDPYRSWGLLLQKLRVAAEETRVQAPYAIQRAMKNHDSTQVNRLVRLMSRCGDILELTGVDNEQPNG